LTNASAWGGSVASDQVSDIPVHSWETVELGGPGGGVNLEHHIEPDDTDGMAISFVDEKDQAFFGPSATMSFMRIILRFMAGAMAQCTGRSPPTGGGGAWENSMVNVNPFHSRMTSVKHGKSPPLDLSPTMLPQDDIMERLIQEYFSNTGMLFPYIHEATFMETYHAVKNSGFTGVRRTWLGLLNIILAMAARADASRSDTAQASADAELFFRRARELCGTQMLRGTTLETVQYLLLSTQYLQGTRRAVQTWTMHGLAVKAALSIGLHSHAASHNLDPITKEMRKRTWYGCIVLDRSLSMTFGRPNAIPEEYVRLELPKTIKGDRVEGLSAVFFSSTVTLYRILWKIMARIYGHNVEHEDLPGAELITRIIQLEHEIEQWRVSLPEHLNLTTSELLRRQTTMATVTLQSQMKLRLILTLRYLNTKLLLLRPVLTDLLQTRFVIDSQTTGCQDRRLVGYMQNGYFTSECFNAAVELIAIIHAAITCDELGKTMLGAWWFTLFYGTHSGTEISYLNVYGYDC